MMITYHDHCAGLTDDDMTDDDSFHKKKCITIDVACEEDG